MKSNKIYVKYIYKDGYGSVDQLINFTWGYLLPAISEILKQSDHQSNVYYFRSSSPVLNEAMAELLDCCEINFKIEDTKTLEYNSEMSELIVPRWDIFFFSKMKYAYFRALLSKDSIYRKTFFKKFYYKVILSDKMVDKKIKALRPQIQNDLYSVQSKIVNDLNHSESEHEIPENIYLAIKRKSALSTRKSCEEKVKAEVNIDNMVQFLQESDVNVHIFDPGDYSYLEQIKIFQKCKGMISADGVEFANAIWLEQGAKLIHLQSTNSTTAFMAEEISKTVNLKYYPLALDNNVQLEQQETILNFFKKKEVITSLSLNALNFKES